MRISFLCDDTLDGREALLKFFEHLIYRNGRDDFPPGCFMMKTAAGLADHGSAVAREVGNSINNLQKGFVQAIERGRREGSLVKTGELDVLAKMLLAQSYGVSVLTRTKIDKKELLGAAHALVDLLSTR